MRVELSVSQQTVERTENVFDVQFAPVQQTVEMHRGTLNLTMNDLSYEHTQAVASTTWTINHNLGKYPSVTIVDTSGREWFGDVEYNSVNQCTATFSAAFGGKAYCN